MRPVDAVEFHKIKSMGGGNNEKKFERETFAEGVLDKALIVPEKN